MNGMEYFDRDSSQEEIKGKVYIGKSDPTDQTKQSANIRELAVALDKAEAVILKAGTGLSKVAGFTDRGKRFEKYFGDFAQKYGFKDMVDGRTCLFETLEEKWAYWSRLIYINRYMKPPIAVYEQLYELIDGRNKGDLASSPRKDYFVLTMNTDHQFQKAGFAKRRMFYGQGDYGLWQCGKPCHSRTYDNKERVVKMVLAQGFSIDEDGELLVPVTENGQTDFTQLVMEVPKEMVPYCPVCGEPMSMNLRAEAMQSETVRIETMQSEAMQSKITAQSGFGAADSLSKAEGGEEERVKDCFVEDEGFQEAAGGYEEFLAVNEGRHILFWEIGVDDKETAGTIFPKQFKSQSFVKLVEENPLAAYACVHEGEALVPPGIADRSIVITGDVGEIIAALHERL